MQQQIELYALRCSLREVTHVWICLFVNLLLLTVPIIRAQERVDSSRTAKDVRTLEHSTQMAIEKAFAEAKQLQELGTAESRRKAIEKYEETLSLWQALKNSHSEARTRIIIGGIYYSFGEMQKALDHFGQALSLFRAKGDKSFEATTLIHLGVVHSNLGEKQKALDYYQQALPLKRVMGDSSGVTAILHNMGRVYADLGDKWKALEYYKQALPRIRAVNDSISEIYTLNSIGRAFHDLGEKQKALGYLDQALQLARVVKNRFLEANTLNNVGGLYADLGENQMALDYYYQSLPLLREMGDRAGEAATLNNIGQLFDDLGEKRKALDYYYRTLPLMQAVGDRDGEATTLNNIAKIFADLGENQKALNHYHQALPIIRAVDNRSLEAITLNNIGNFYDNLYEWRKALDHYEQALELHQAVSNRAGQASTLNNIGLIYTRLGNKQKALDYYNNALPLTRAINDRYLEAITCNNIGGVYADSGDTQKALNYYHQALPLRRALGDRTGEAATLHNIGGVYVRLGDREKALDFYHQALRLSQAVEDRSAEAIILSKIAGGERDRGNFLQARTQIETVINIFESLRTKVVSPEWRTSYLASKQGYYKFYIDLLMQLHQLHPSEGYNATALQVSERTRARSLLELLTGTRMDIHRGVNSVLVVRKDTLLQQLYTKEQYRMQLVSGEHTEEQLATVKKEIRGLDTELDEIEAQILATSPHYAALTQPPIRSSKEIQQEVLDDSTMLLEYSLGEKRSFLWAVTPTMLRSFELPKRSVIDSAARRVYRLLVRDDSVYPQAADSLSQILLGPVAKQLGTKRLLIVADGILQYIPFGALPIPDTTTKQSKTINPPLLVEHEVISLPSASVLAERRRDQKDRKPVPKTVAILADPVFSSEDDRVKEGKNKDTRKVYEQPADTSETSISALTGKRAVREVNEEMGWPPPRLIFSGDEANAIAALVPNEECKKALSFEASRATVTSKEMSQYRIVHFSTHAFLNSEHPELSGIVLSLVDKQGKPQDGFLRLHDVYNLNLPADLVVLSACQTALGKDIWGEGLVGLTRGFMYAGTSRIVASLWKVDDNATKKLMARFYEGMLGKENSRPAAALRAAQLSMYNERGLEGAYYWAGFILQGEWD
jgi:CHAT domain-containing protein/Tfp pilus assembly protein PilF